MVLCSPMVTHGHRHIARIVEAQIRQERLNTILPNHSCLNFHLAILHQCQVADLHLASHTILNIYGSHVSSTLRNIRLAEALTGNTGNHLCPNDTIAVHYFHPKRNLNMGWSMGICSRGYIGRMWSAHPMVTIRKTERFRHRESHQALKPRLVASSNLRWMGHAETEPWNRLRTALSKCLKNSRKLPHNRFQNLAHESPWEHGCLSAPFREGHPKRFPAH